jgi:hypothetical protein
VRNNKKYWFLLFGLTVLLLGATVGCGLPGYTTYTNQEEGYTISYPDTWQAEVSKDSTTCLIISPTHAASLVVYVAGPITAQNAAQYWIMSLGTHWQEITQIANKPMEGFWDWYVEYEYQADTGPFHGEAYFKTTKDHLYRLDTAADSAGYNNYPFPTIISSFKLK